MSVVRKIHVAVGLVLIFGLLLPGIISCTTAPPAAQSPAPSPTPAPTPKPAGPTGTLVVALGSLSSERWIPHLSSAPEMALAGQIYEFLIYRKPGTSELIPGLAEKWTMAPDGLSWTFNLRKGIQFHEGWGEFTGIDVKYTFELLISQSAINTLTSYLRANVTSVEVSDPYTVIFRMKVPTWDLGYRLSTGGAFFGIVSKKYIDAVGMDKATKNPIGSGPFKFAELKAGEYLKLEALDKHWRQVPAFKTLVFRAVPEEATRLAMLRTGEADIIDMSAAVKGEVEKAGFRVVVLSDSRATALHFGGMISPTRPTYDPNIPWVGPDPERALKVRKAIALAIDKEEIIKYVLQGLAKPLVVQHYFSDMPQTDPAWKSYPYDPEQSKRLLAEAGFPNGFDLPILSLILSGAPEHGLIAEAVALQLGKVGIRAKIEKTDYTAYRNRMAERKVGGVVFPFSVTRRDEPVMILDVNSVSKSTYLFGIEDTKLDKMVATALGELDYNKRLSLQREIGKYIYDNYHYVPIASLPTIFGANKRVGDWPLIPTFAYPFYFEYLTHGTAP